MAETVEGWVYHQFKGKNVLTWHGSVCVECGLHLSVHLEGARLRGDNSEVGRLDRIITYWWTAVDA